MAKTAINVREVLRVLLESRATASFPFESSKLRIEAQDGNNDLVATISSVEGNKLPKELLVVMRQMPGYSCYYCGHPNYTVYIFKETQNEENSP